MPIFTRTVLVSVIFSLSNSFAAHASMNCDGALAKDTFSLSERMNVDWRLATLVTKEQYDQRSSAAGANATIYGIPIGASYTDFQSNLQKYYAEHNESMSIGDARTIATATLSENELTAYLSCLNLNRTQFPGLHLYSTHATIGSVVVHV